MRVQVIGNLKYEMIKYFGHAAEADTQKFYDSISGKEIEIIFIGADAFEKEDNQHWLPNHTWYPVIDNEEYNEG